MEDGYAMAPLALSRGDFFLVGTLEADGMIRMEIQDQIDPLGESQSVPVRLGWVTQEDMRHFISDAMPCSLKTDTASSDEIEAVFRVDGPFVHVRFIEADGKSDGAMLRRDEFKAFGEGIIGKVFAGGFFV